MQQQNDYQGPLAGLNVIDFGHYYAGPMVGMLLADQGANVIRIVRLGEKESSTYHKELSEQQYRLLNRNKKLLTLDLKTPAGKEQALSLIERADVVIENFRPGVMKRLGLDYTSVKEKNPGLVYLSLPGFASTDKERAHIQAWEGILGAAAGVYTQANPFREYFNFPPVYSSIPQCSMYGALQGAVAVMAALTARQSHGIGTVAEVPLVDAGLSGFLIEFSGHFFFPSTPRKTKINLPESLKPLVFSTEDTSVQQREKLEKIKQFLIGTPCSKPHVCADGRQIYIHSIFANSKFVKRLLRALGIDNKLMREGFVLTTPWQQPGLDNNVCDHSHLSVERKQRFEQLVSTAFLTKTAAEWEIILQEASVPAAVIRTRQEWLALEPLLKSGVFTRLDNGSSVLTVPGRAADISGPEKTLFNRYREVESITASQASELFNNHPSIKSLQGRHHHKHVSLKKGDLLHGLKILDLSNLFAGPSSTHFLAGYGADVIKADPLISLPPGPQPSGFSGKRSILTDVKTAPGRDVFERLISWADVVLHNSLDDTAKKLGVTHTQLQNINPNVVSCQFSAYGGTWRNGLEARQGVEPLLQSASGLMAHFGSLEEPHLHGTVAAADSIGGLCLAFATLLGVYQRHRTGYAGEGRSSLARSVNYYQLPWMIAENGCSDWNEARGQFAVGEQWWQRLYACCDGWVYVGTSENRAIDLAEIVIGRKGGNEQSLETEFAKQNVAYWQKKLDVADIACHPVLTVDDICNKCTRMVSRESANEQVKGSGQVLCWEDNIYGYPMTSLAPNYVRIGEDHSWKRLGIPAAAGEQTREILQALGYTEEEIEELVRLKVTHEYSPTLNNSDAAVLKQENRSNG